MEAEVEAESEAEAVRRRLRLRLRLRRRLRLRLRRRRRLGFREPQAPAFLRTSLESSIFHTWGGLVLGEDATAATTKELQSI